jgi:predicted enzyme related to lactoylglutathione lyase
MTGAVDIQLVVFAADPHRLARFWAAALGYVLEDNEPLIEGVIAAGFATEADTIVIDGQRFWSEAVAIRHPDGAHGRASANGPGIRILFELAPARKVDDNRLHLDLNVGHDRIDEETRRVIGLGATLLEERRDPPKAMFNRLADPEGNELCIQ